jgi:hypothetical protein
MRSTWSDSVGQTLSVLCLVHCAVTPLVVALAPALTGIFGRAHPVLLVLVLATALWAFVPGYRHHHSRSMMLFAVAGIALLAVGALVFADNFALDTSFTIAGAGLMLVAHVKNRAAHRACHACAAEA